MAIVFVSFAGINGTGIISVPGLRIGDRVLNVAQAPNNSQVLNVMAQFVTVDDEITQSSLFDLSGNTYFAILDRQVVIVP